MAAKAYEEFYKELGIKAKELICKIAKNKERESKDLDEVRCAKDEICNDLVTGENI